MEREDDGGTCRHRLDCILSPSSEDELERNSK
jgi:hypothetical protein